MTIASIIRKKIDKRREKKINRKREKKERQFGTFGAKRETREQMNEKNKGGTMRSL